MQKAKKMFTPQSVGSRTLHNTTKTLKDMEGHVNQFKLLAPF
jgi:hypothetical protein